ncbi:barnase inhibitor [Arthrobacter sp. SRS-W-1-2016]|uniref:barstar family protein n=1 Tax=Arthrobacter sp. SRS-W-1-2016 TaxID=1930254 RepID=UPI000990CA2B|nr:barstar family protein [Arthrobacter sp. SRS-W-1-2016]OOP63131.1 barnase inhibitor [Arthrobacter sp. SRS-W-1-2016]
MNAFGSEADVEHDLDFRLLINTAVSLFHRRPVLDETTTWLAEQGYQVTILDASSWSSEADVHAAISEALDFPSYYGRNLDALNDCLRDVISHDYGWDADATGFVLAFLGYDAFALACPGTAQTLLDIIAQRSREAALFGHRMICLVQSNDSRISFDPVGATPVLWNDAEWLDSRRLAPQADTGD